MFRREHHAQRLVDIVDSTNFCLLCQDYLFGGYSNDKPAHPIRDIFIFGKYPFFDEPNHLLLWRDGVV